MSKTNDGEKGNGSRVWIRCLLGILGVGLISMGNVVYTNGKDITSNSKAIQSNRTLSVSEMESLQKLTNLHLSHIREDIGEIKSLLKRNDGHAN